MLPSINRLTENGVAFYVKRTVRIILIILIMLATVLTFAYIGIMHRLYPAGMGSVEDVGSDVGPQSSDTRDKQLILPDGDIILQVGQSRQCRIQFEDGSPAEGVFWSSGDENVARVSSGGRVTAIAAGEAEILAILGKDHRARIKVSIYEDLTSAAAQAVTNLAADGSDDSMQLVESMAQSLSHASDKKTTDLAAMMHALAAFRQAGEKGDNSAPQLWETLMKAVETAQAEIDPMTLRQAALAAYSHGEKSSAEMTITFTGDCTFAYYNESNAPGRFPAVYRRSGSLTYPFDLTRQVFGADDITMINFEGTLTDSTQHKYKQFYFRGEPSFANILPASSVEAVTVENNHSGDYLEIGYADTLFHLKKAGIAYTDFQTPAVLNVKGMRAVMISLCLVDTTFTDEARQQIEDFVGQFKQKNTIVIMNVHWGIERDHVPDATQINAAHFMIDAGVDLVIGHHPHVPQGIEFYNGHYIFYSLGNFAFGGNARATMPETLMVRAMFGRDDEGNAVLSRLSVIPCLTTSSGSPGNNYRPTPLYGESGAQVISELLQLSAQVDGGIKSLTWSMIP